MATRTSKRRLAKRTAALAIAAAASLGLTACGTSLGAQTEEKQTAIAGVNAEAGPVSLRDLQVEFISPGGYAEGDSAPLRVWFSSGPNSESTLIDAEVDPEVAEKITFVSSEAHESAGSEEQAEDTSEDEAPQEEGTEGDTAEGAEGENAEGDTAQDETAEDGEQGSADESQESGETDESASDADETGQTEQAGETEQAASGSDSIEVTVAARDYVRLDVNSLGQEKSPGYLQLEGLKAPLASGQHIDITFTFDVVTIDEKGDKVETQEKVEVTLPVGQPMEQHETEEVDTPGMGAH
ncbi:hypothetical protein [Salininema proteolyticum]|uniref:Copper(I)-binding protein n=1 Tax=Salininema proteolyticum TaxID=1607685 RepID=A0ABV8U452_9ACTN